MQDDPGKPLRPTTSAWRLSSGGSLLIRGGFPLTGTYPISGAKNAVLPLMVSALLTPYPVALHNIPDTLDVAVLATLFQRLGAVVHRSSTEAGLSIIICADRVRPGQVDQELVTRMRASVLLLGALLARCGQANLPMPGGDAIGLRSIDFHIAGLRAMGASIDLEGGTIRATAPRGLRGAEVVLPQPSVGATENLLVAAVLATGTTVIRNAAREPEVADLAQCLVTMGAGVSGIRSDTLKVRGGLTLSGTAYPVMPDRIEMGTVACAAAITDGEVLLRHGRLDLLGAAVPALIEAGVDLGQTAEGVIAHRSSAGLVGIDFQTRPYPGFATDLQAPVMALLSTAVGASMVTETVFEHRFRHVDELRKMGADIKVLGRTAFLRGVPKLQGAVVTGKDVRGAGALVIAGLGADGQTVVGGLEHLDRGYDRMAEKLSRVVLRSPESMAEKPEDSWTQSVGRPFLGSIANTGSTSKACRSFGV
jgi:UDP-N-acetylglucosamine 1-carboxyvinyltransferase